MHRYPIDDIAQAELDSVGGVYIPYFARLGDPAKGRAWADHFYRTYRERIEELKEDPARHGRCRVYPFDALTLPDDSPSGGAACARAGRENRPPPARGVLG